MHDLTWVSPQGQEWDLTEGGGTAGIMSGGISGLVGSVEDEADQLVGVPGQVLLRQSVRPMEGTLKVLLRDEIGMERLYGEFRNAFHHKREGTLSIAGWHSSKFSTHLRLNGPIGEPEVKPGLQDYHMVEIPLIGDTGVWWSEPQLASGSGIEVNNFGDVDIWPELVWESTSGTVTLPSGLQISIPWANKPMRLLMNPRDAFEVVDADGVINKVVSQSTRRQGVWPECVRPDRTAQFSTRHSNSTSRSRMELVWRIGVLDPWR